MKQALEVVHGVDRHAGAPDLTLGHRMIRVVSHLRRKVERHRQTRLPRREQVTEPRVRVLGGPEPRVLAHRPQLPTVHRRVDAPRERKHAWRAEIPRGIAAPVPRSVHGFAVAHELPITSVAKLTSALLPITSGVR